MINLDTCFGKMECFVIGWVPVEKNSKQYCWHTSVVNYEAEMALVLKHHADPGLLEIRPVSLSELLEQTLELIGTNINANPYGKFVRIKYSVIFQLERH